MEKISKAKYAQLKQDILGDGIKESKLEAFKKLAISLFGDKEIMKDLVAHVTFSGGLPVIEDAKEYFEIAKKLNNKYDTGQFFSLLNSLPNVDSISDIPDGSSLPFSLYLETPDSKVRVGGGMLTMWFLYAVQLITSMGRSDSQSPSSMLFAALVFYVLPYMVILPYRYNSFEKIQLEVSADDNPILAFDNKVQCEIEGLIFGEHKLSCILPPGEYLIESEIEILDVNSGEIYSWTQVIP